MPSDQRCHLDKDLCSHTINIIYWKALSRSIIPSIMVVAVVIKIPHDSFKSPSDAADFYMEKLEKGGAKKTGTFQVDLVSYSPLTGNSKLVHVLSHSEYPASAFAFAEQSNCQMVVADNTFVALMNKLRTLHLFDTRLPRMEARGTRFEYQDFVINLSTVNQSQTTKGIILEVSYVLTDGISGGYVLIQELLQSFLNITKPMLYKLLTDKLNEWIQSTKDKKRVLDENSSMTILQYLEILNNMRKQPNE